MRQLGRSCPAFPGGPSPNSQTRSRNGLSPPRITHGTPRGRYMADRPTERRNLPSSDPWERCTVATFENSSLPGSRPSRGSGSEERGRSLASSITSRSPKTFIQQPRRAADIFHPELNDRNACGRGPRGEATPFAPMNPGALARPHRWDRTGDFGALCASVPCGRSRSLFT